MKTYYILLFIGGGFLGLLLGINDAEFSLINILLMILVIAFLLFAGINIGIKSQYENTCK